MDIVFNFLSNLYEKRNPYKGNPYNASVTTKFVLATNLANSCTKIQLCFTPCPYSEFLSSVFSHIRI